MASLKELNDKVPRRVILGILMFLACMFSYFIRTNLSINITVMVQNPGKNKIKAVCEMNKTSATNRTYIDERYPWTEFDQGWILGAYFYGPVLASIPAGLAAERFGGSRVVAYATLIPALLNLLMPVAAGWHWTVLFVLRFLMGFSGAAVYPALHAMMARWVPPNEKGMFVWTMQGGPFGTFVTMALCSIIIENLGWKASFYITSGLMLIFYLMWVWLAYDGPDDHPTITEHEKAYIKEKIGNTVRKHKSALPIKALCTSKPFLALLWAHFSNMWGIYFTATYGAKYTFQVLGLPTVSGGFLVGLPYIARLGAGTLFAAAGDYLRSRQIISVAWIRKSFMIFSHVLPGICLIVMTLAGCDAVTAMTMMILALAFNGAACQTSLQNHQDLAPNFAGSLYGIMNTIGNFPGFIIPAIISAVVTDHPTLGQWSWIFWISAIIFFSATIVFWIFGSATIQPWNDLIPADKVPSEDTPEEEKQMTITTVTGKEVPQSEEEDENERL